MVTQLFGRTYCVFVVGLMIISICLPIASAEIVITENGTIESADINFSRFDIWEDRIVWNENRNGDTHHDEISNIFLYNISSTQESQITHDDDTQINPSIFKNIICWGDYRSVSTYKIYYFDLELNQEISIDTAGGTKGGYSSYNNILVYTDTRNTNDDHPYNNDIFSYDLATNEEIQITCNTSQEGTTHRGQSSIWDDRIVYDVSGGEHSGIYMYNLSSQQEIRIYNSTETETEPTIWGDIIVWSIFDSNESWYHNLTTGQTHRLPTIGNGRDIYGRYIVYTNANGNISLFDTGTGKEIPLPIIGGAGRIWKNTIAYIKNDKLHWLKFEFISDVQPQPEDDDPDYLPYFLLSIVILASVAGTSWYRKIHRKG